MDVHFDAEDREDLQISRKAYESTRDPERHTDAEPEEQKQILFRSFIFARHLALITIINQQNEKPDNTHHDVAPLLQLSQLSTGIANMIPNP